MDVVVPLSCRALFRICAQLSASDKLLVLQEWQRSQQSWQTNHDAMQAELKTCIDRWAILCLLFPAFSVNESSDCTAKCKSARLNWSTHALLQQKQYTTLFCTLPPCMPQESWIVLQDKAFLMTISNHTHKRACFAGSNTKIHTYSCNWRRGDLVPLHTICLLLGNSGWYSIHSKAASPVLGVGSVLSSVNDREAGQ